MAINYASVFQNLGKLISKNNSYGSLASTTLPADLQAIIAQFGTAATTYGDAQGPIQGLTNTYASMQGDIAKWRRSLAPYGDRVLTDVDTVVSQIAGLSSTDIRTVLAAIVQNMVDVGQTVKGNTVTLGTPAAVGSGNVGNGEALVDLNLDGYNAPLRGTAANVLYNGLASQLAVPSETMLITCTTDSFGGGVEGAEQWSWTGGQAWQLFDWHTEGSGGGLGLQTANAATLLQNLNFESFSTANTPDSWTIAAGAAGTDIFQETSAANIFRGSSALRFTGTGLVKPSITQAFTVSQLQSRRRYLCTVQSFATGAVGGGNLTIKLTGTGYAAAGSEQINVALAAIPGTYKRYSFYINLPSTIPSNLTMSVAITGANLGNGSNVYLDSMTFSPVVYHGGVNAQVIAGSTPWCKGDRISWTVSNNSAGNFQEYFRRCYGVQLPAKTDGTQTILDTWAQ